MTMHKDKVKHQKKGGIIRPQIPGWGEDQRRIHRVQRRIRRAPWWLWVITAVLLAITIFATAWSWSAGRSSVYAEQRDEAVENQLAAEQARDELENRITVLDTQIAAAPDQATVVMLEFQRDLALVRVAVLKNVIIGWQGLVTAMDGQIDRLEQSVETKEQTIRTQTNRANTLQRAETLRIVALPGQIVANLTASPPSVIGDYRIAIAQETLKEAFGQSFFGWMDELKSVTARGTANFIALGPYEAVNQGKVTEVKLHLPTLVSHGIYGYTLESFDYEPGFLARVDVQDVSELMVWVENSYLVPTACADASTMHSIVESAEAQTQSVVGEREIKVVWISQSGQEFTSEQLSDSILLANAC